MEKKSSATPKDLAKQYQLNLSNNLRKIFENKIYTEYRLAEELRRSGLDIQQGTLSRYIHPEKYTDEIPLSVAVHLCKVLGCDISKLVSADADFGASGITTDPEALKRINTADNAVLLIPNLGGGFISRASHEDFRAYKQAYHCYFFPTVSSERNIIHARLFLEGPQDENSPDICGARMRIESSQILNNTPIIKEYSGCAVISKSVQSLYILLSSPAEGEICVINLKYMYIRHQTLDCRMAVVLTNAAGSGHAPTIHRMLLSRDEIRPEDLEDLGCELNLSNNHMMFTEEALMELREQREDYRELIDHLTAPKHAQPVRYYRMREDYLQNNADPFLGGKLPAMEFVQAVRKLSAPVHYNKISNRVDERVRKLLLARGYYRTPATDGTDGA